MIFSPILTDENFATTDKILANTDENIAITDGIIANTDKNVANTDNILTNTDGTFTNTDVIFANTDKNITNTADISTTNTTDKNVAKILLKSLYLAPFLKKVGFCVYRRNSRWPSKWRENNFCEKWPVDCADTLWNRNFVEIAPSRSVSEINTFLCLTQKFKMAAKVVGK